MDQPSQELLSVEAVAHLAKLARLKLSEAELQQYRQQLSAVLHHVGRLETLDVEGVDTIVHPYDFTSRLDDDEPTGGMPLDQFLALAPAVEGDYLAVPKVMGE